MLVPAAAFAAGLSCALTAFGVAASSFGALYGSVGDGALASALPVVLSLLICGMGLNLLKVLPFELPSLALDNVPGARLRPRRARFFGASTALVSSPCATPVLVSILGFVAATGGRALGAGIAARVHARVHDARPRRRRRHRLGEEVRRDALVVRVGAAGVRLAAPSATARTRRSLGCLARCEVS